MSELLALSGPALCLVVLGLLVVESGLLVGVVVPGDSLLFGAGLLVGTGRVDVPVAVLALSAWFGAFVGDGLGYGLGRRFGRPWVGRGSAGWRGRFLLAAERLYERHGWFAVVICRWFPGVRAMVPTLAGVGRMHPAAFVAANGLGAVLWAVAMVLLGYGTAWLPWVRDGALWAMLASIAVTVAYGLVHLRRHVVRLGARRRQAVASAAASAAASASVQVGPGGGFARCQRTDSSTRWAGSAGAQPRRS